MKFRKSKVALALGFGVGGGMLVAAFGAGAQDAPVQVAQQADIRVEVTGSNIKRVEGEGALPVTVLNRAQIERTGATNAMELLQVITANNSAGNVSLGNVIGTTTFSTQTASLRGSMTNCRRCRPRWPCGRFAGPKPGRVQPRATARGKNATARRARRTVAAF